MNELSLFTGAGGGVLGSKLLGHRIIGYVEKDDYCQRMLAQRIRDGVIDNAPIYSDIKTFIDSGRCELYRGITDIVSAGFPCQDFSIANLQRQNGNGEKNLWSQTAACLRLIRPRVALLENVPNLYRTTYGRRISGDLAEMFLHIRGIALSYAYIGGNIVRKRIWVLAFTSSIGWDEIEVFCKSIKQRTEKTHRERELFGIIPCGDTRGRLWAFRDTDLERSFDGMADWVDSIKSIGNGQVPAVVKLAFQTLTGA